VPPHTLDVAAPAKVNLFLRVLGRRDDGYHELETLVAPVGMADRLRVHAFSDPDVFRSLSVTLELTGDPEHLAGVPLDERNLVLRAAAALSEAAGGVRGFADFVLEKRVPAAAGLGGGSGDAAAALTALNALWGLGLGDDELSRVAAAVGSDVPALLAGRPVVARGRGERTEAVPVAGFSFVVVPFAFGVSTADAFGWWDEDGVEPGPDPAPALAALRPDAGGLPALGPLLRNDLEAPVVSRHPEVGHAKDRLLAAGVTAAFMTGSGPTVVGILPRGAPRLDARTERDMEGIAGRPVVYASSQDS
jgi:4-diphosphocytidyl-2-C-methyl-D-erythritol kinase